MNLTKSVGQANHHCNLPLRSAGTSVVQRLASLSIAGRGLGIELHQHIGYRLHLVWHVTEHGKTTTRCLVRVFGMFEDVHQFRNDIVDGG